MVDHCLCLATHMHCPTNNIMIQIFENQRLKVEKYCSPENGVKHVVIPAVTSSPPMISTFSQQSPSLLQPPAVLLRVPVILVFSAGRSPSSNPPSSSSSSVARGCQFRGTYPGASVQQRTMLIAPHRYMSRLSRLMAAST